MAQLLHAHEANRAPRCRPQQIRRCQTQKCRRTLSERGRTWKEGQIKAAMFNSVV